MSRNTTKGKRGRPITAPVKEKTVRPEIACKDCRRKFTPVRADQKFCQDSCRKEFHQYGRMSVSKIAERVERRLAATFGARIRELETQLKTIFDELHPKKAYPENYDYQ